jgi:signal transduction histidine kinase/ActR/RegA family two-component response regulator
MAWNPTSAPREDPHAGDPPDLSALVAHWEKVQAAATVEQVLETFRHHGQAFAAVVEGARFLGLVSRGQLGGMVGSRFGFALHSRHAIRHHLLPGTLAVTLGTPLLEVLEMALRREGEAFHQDLALVAEDGMFLGILPVPALVRVQAGLMAGQVRLAERQGLELEHRNRELTRLRDMKRRFAQSEKSAFLETLVGGIAHEINNKLAPVLGYAGLLGLKLRALPGTEEAREFCRIIETSARESGTIIQQLRHLSRPATPELAWVDLQDLIRDARALIRFRLLASGTHLDVALPSPCPRVRVDPIQIKQLLLNLLFNAIDAMETAATKRLSLRVTTRPGTFTLEVRDSGMGIPPDQLRRIFDPFFSTKGPDHGTGLGLNVCLTIVKQHHGDLQVESVPGEGSIFRATLPLVPEAAPLPPEAPPAREPAARGGPKPHALVVDDEEFITMLLQETLRTRLGWRLSQAHDGAEAIARLREGGIDVVITDLRMPGMDGFALLAWLQGNEPELYRRTLVVTGDPGGQGNDLAWAGHAVPVLRKPFAVEDLLAACTALEASGQPWK